MEASLLLVAAVLAWLLGHPLLSDLHWRAEDFFVGLAASIPLCALFWWMLRSTAVPLERIRGLLDTQLRPLFAPWSTLDIAIVSALAGVAEEVLFRSVIQGALSAAVGPVPALLVASLLFGCAHLVTLGYGVIAAAIGAYLGLWWMVGENLLIPIVIHAAYDFAALVYWLRTGSADSEPVN